MPEIPEQQLKPTCRYCGKPLAGIVSRSGTKEYECGTQIHNGCLVGIGSDCDESIRKAQR